MGRRGYCGGLEGGDQGCVMSHEWIPGDAKVRMEFSTNLPQISFPPPFSSALLLATSSGPSPASL